MELYEPVVAQQEELIMDFYKRCRTPRKMHKNTVKNRVFKRNTRFKQEKTYIISQKNLRNGNFS